jgi:hypothetical protein
VGGGGGGGGLGGRVLLQQGLQRLDVVHRVAEDGHLRQDIYEYTPWTGGSQVHILDRRISK